MKYIIFTAQDKEMLTGEYGKFSELNPLEFNTGEFAVGVEVLKDPEYSVIHSALALLPQRELSENDFK